MDHVFLQKGVNLKPLYRLPRGPAVSGASMPCFAGPEKGAADGAAICPMRGWNHRDGLRRLPHRPIQIWYFAHATVRHSISIPNRYLITQRAKKNGAAQAEDGTEGSPTKRDPTLRPGDIISTKEGLLAYTGRSVQGATFTPVNPATLRSI